MGRKPTSLTRQEEGMRTRKGKRAGEDNEGKKRERRPGQGTTVYRSSRLRAAHSPRREGEGIERRKKTRGGGSRRRLLGGMGGREKKKENLQNGVSEAQSITLGRLKSFGDPGGSSSSQANIFAYGNTF